MRPTLSKRFHLAWIATALVVGVWAYLQVRGLAVTRTRALVHQLAVPSVGIAAAIACWRAARAADTPFRAAWRLFGLGALSWSFGDVAWAIYEFRGDELPLPSAADGGYLIFPVFIAAGLITLIPGAQGWQGRVRALLDGLLIAGSAFAIWWVLVLEDLVQMPGESPLAKLLGIAYPVSDVVLVALVAYVIVRLRQEEHETPVSIVLLAVGLLSMSYADVAFARATLGANFDGSEFFEAGWITALGFILVAALHFHQRRLQPVEVLGPARPFAQFVPYAGLAVAGTVTMLFDSEIHGSELWLWAALITTLSCRQILTVHENRQLTNHLEQRVIDRTRDLEASEQRFRALVQRSSDVVMVIDAAGQIQYVTDSIEAVFGYSSQMVTAMDPQTFVNDEGTEHLRTHVRELITNGGASRTVEVQLPHRDGSLRAVAVTITNMLDEPTVKGVVLNMHDVSDQRALEARLVHDALHDTLTGLPNRALLLERLTHALARRGHGEIAILFIDLDDFKRVNDTLGHAAGDTMLTQVAERLLRSVRQSETVARLGGDEFAILIEDVDPAFSPSLVAERIARAMRSGIRIRGREVAVRASIGIAIAQPDDDAGRLLQSADLAMYRAKSMATGKYVIYDPSMHKDYLARVQLEEDLRASVGAGALRVHYQPIFDLVNARMVGVEALVRWRHPQLGLVEPATFITVAEECGMITQIGEFVLSESLRQIAEWSRCPGGEDLSVSVNVSAAELHGDGLVSFLRQRLATTGIDPARLVVEITESVLVEDTEENLETLRKLKALGVRIAIDDFGTGYSSLSYLHRFPADVLKVDRSFVDRLGVAERDSEFVRTIVGLGRNLGLVTLAEGIETRAQWDELVRAGCVLGQGRIFSMPVDAAELSSQLAEWTAVGTALR